jgi:hypothetical protein
MIIRPKINSVTHKLSTACLPEGMSTGDVVAEERTENYYIFMTKKASGLLSGGGWFLHAGAVNGLVISFPGGFAAMINEDGEPLFSVAAGSKEAEPGGAIDGFKSTNYTATTFTVITSHLLVSDGLSLEYSDEKFAFIFEGRWK